MTTNRLAKSTDSTAESRHAEKFANCPNGDSPEDKAARRAYWIRVGNEELDKAGKTHLQWACVNDHYFIEPR